MKKQIIVLLCLFPLLSLTGQTINDSIQSVQFISYINDYSKNLNEAKDKNNYQEAINLTDSLINRYHLLSEKNKKSFAGNLPYMYFISASLYSLDGNKDTAIEAFSKAIDAGFTEYRRTKKDKDFDNIRTDERFLKLMETLRDNDDFIYMIQKGGSYVKRPVFTYQDASSPDLVKIRKFFNLDSIAGKGDELSKIKNLMSWTHNLIPHNGGYWADIELNAINIYNHSKEKNTGMNCRSQAIFLNECFLALGMKSRYITCYPRDNYHQEAHVINVVYSKTLDKWIWVDATFNTFVTDEKNNYLDIAEVRQRLIDEHPVLISQDANWNNKEEYTKETYIDDYMAKLLYWFDCPAKNEVNTDKDLSKDSTVALLPEGFDMKKQNFRYFTFDDSYFWEK